MKVGPLQLKPSVGPTWRWGVRHQLWTILAALLGLAGVAQADSYKMKDGRYASGPVTVLALSAEQVLTTKTKRVVVLTSAQKTQLKREAGTAPSVLSIHSLKVAGKDCTCGEYNIAIWFSPSEIEVPHGFLITDDDAERAADEWEGGEEEESQ